MFFLMFWSQILFHILASYISSFMFFSHILSYSVYGYSYRTVSLLKAYSLAFLSHILSYIRIIILSIHILTTYTLSCSFLCSDHIFSSIFLPLSSFMLLSHILSYSVYGSSYHTLSRVFIVYSLCYLLCSC